MSIDELEKELKLWGREDEDETDIGYKIIRRINKKKREEYKQKLDEIVKSKKKIHQLKKLKKKFQLKKLKKKNQLKWKHINTYAQQMKENM